MRPIFSRLLSLLAVSWVSHASAQVATYSEATFPDALVLKPGVTRITGGITAADQTDRFHFLNTAGGSITARVTYTHRSPNLLSGVTEWAHLAGTLSNGFHGGEGYFLVASTASLSSPFYVQDASNTIRASRTMPDFESEAGTFELTVVAPPGKVNPGYTIELDYVPAADAFEAGAGNHSAATAVVRDPQVPGRIAGSISGTADSDWVRYDVPAGKTLRIHFEDRQPSSGSSTAVAPGPQPLRSELLNAQGIPLQTATSPTAVFTETAGPGGQTYYLRVSPQDDYAAVWRAAWVLDDALEPNDSLPAARYLGPLTAGGRLEFPDLTVMDQDHYTFFSALPAGTPIVAATIPYGSADPTGGQRMQAVAGTTTAEENRNYVVLTTGANGTVTLRVSGGPHRYRLLIKPQSAYDVWQQAVSGEVFALPPYLPGESDDDGDGLPAALERALNRSPFAATASAISAPYFDGSAWRVNVAMPQGGSVAAIRVQESTDLSVWTGLPAARGNFGGDLIPAGRTSGAVITLSRPGEERNFLRFAADD